MIPTYRLAGVTRLELVVHGVKDRCLTAWLRPNILHFKNGNKKSTCVGAAIILKLKKTTSMLVEVVIYLYSIVHLFKRCAIMCRFPI